MYLKFLHVQIRTYRTLAEIIRWKKGIPIGRHLSVKQYSSNRSSQILEHTYWLQKERRKTLLSPIGLAEFRLNLSHGRACQVGRMLQKDGAGMR